ncbi:MAG: FeoA family protein [Phycisphaerales bacterium]
MTACDHNPVQTRSGPTVPLAQLASGQRCRVAAMNINPAEAQLLNAMGLTDHCELCVCRPGEPCIIRINCTRLGLAGSLARRILVRQLFPQT